MRRLILASRLLLSPVMLLGLAGCGGSNMTPPPAISVSFPSGSAQTIAQGQSVALTASAANDSSGKGLNWTLSGAGSLSNQSNFSVQYNAPATVAASVTATITATDLTDPSKSASDVVTVTPAPQVSITLNPTSANVALNLTQQFTSMVQNDSANVGLSWTLTQGGSPCSPACGSLTATSTPDNTTNTYTPPATMPANTSITLTATSMADPSKSATASIAIVQPVISVALSAPSFSVEAGSSEQVTAVVSYDPAKKGVSVSSWTLSPPTGAGTLTNTSATSATYTAPATSPSNDLAVTISAASASDSTKTGMLQITVPAIAISLSAANSVAEAGTTDQITATVTNDPTNAGVNVSSWTLNPSSGAGTLTSTTIASATYTAPPTPPNSDLSVIVTATSISDPTKTGGITITVPAISLSSVTPSSALIPLNVLQDFATVIQNDSLNKGISWALSQGSTACLNSCGTLSTTNTASAAPTTYAAPASVPSNPSITLTATSATDPTKTSKATLTISVGTVKLVPYNLDFGNFKGNARGSKTVFLTNTGNSSLTISAITTDSSFAQTNNCGTSVAPAATCSITVMFTSSIPGSFTGHLSIADSSVDSPQLVMLSATVRRSRGVLLSSSLASEPTTTVPAPTGPNLVGTRIMSLLDTSRTDPFVRDATPRELLVRFWYPASLSQACVPADYTSPAVWSYFSQLLGISLPDVHTNSCLEAAVSPGIHPIVIFTPGYTGTFTDYTFLFEELASRGYVVVSIDHTNEATAVEFPDGRFVKSVFGSNLGGELRSDEEGYASAVTTRLADIKFVINELGRLNSSARSPFAGKLDILRVAIAGHSLGGLTAILALQQEPRLKVAIVLDGVMPQTPLPAISKPVFMMIAGRGQWSNEECQLWGNLLGPRLSIDLLGAEHIAPSDAIWLAKSAVNTGSRSPEQTVDVLRYSITAFLDANLRSKTLSPLHAESHDTFASHQQQVACSEK